MKSPGKIGVGIITCNRPEMLKKCCLSLKDNATIDEIIIIDDGTERVSPNWFLENRIFHTENGELEINNRVSHNYTNLGVGESKNKALNHLLDTRCDHIFLIEDDIFIKDPTVFLKYIEASLVSGIQHFNFSQHGLMNKTFDGRKTPNPRLIVDYGGVKIPLYPHCVGAFSYYSKYCLDFVGLLDERYVNACEHVDHTYQIIKKEMHPPFWYFADIENSWEYLGDEEWSLANSTISSKPNHQQMMRDADKIFVETHGHLPVETPQVGEEDVIKTLKEIKKTWTLQL